MWPFDRKKKLREFVQSLGEKKTPDVPILEQSANHLLFVCDDMQRPHQNYDKIAAHSRKVGRGFTADHFDFMVGKKTGKGIPIHNKEGLKIKGEFHIVRNEHFTTLDNYYDNGVQFARLRLKFIVTDRIHEIIEIGDEERLIKGLPRGEIRTNNELGIRHYTSIQRVGIVHAYMYVALRKYWLREDRDGNTYGRADVHFPKDNIVWLPKYYKYPINRNRCQK